MSELNTGSVRLPQKPREQTLAEVVIDPDFGVGMTDLAPTARVLQIEHPRLGSLTFLFSPQAADRLKQGLA